MIELLAITAVLISLLLGTFVWRYCLIHGEIMSQSKDYLDRCVRLVDFQEDMGLVFAYDREDGSFVAQGPTREECMQSAVQIWPDRLFLTEIGELGKKDIFKDAAEYAVRATIRKNLPQ
jgi:hypothetical protein